MDLSDNAIASLAPYAAEERTLYFSRYKFRLAIRRAKLKWTRDIMRHTYASYHLARHQNAAATALQLGHHGDTTVLFAHYRNVIRREHAATFWQLRPLSAKVIPLPRVATTGSD
ncbi:MAG TPA: hypothetical protein PKE12_02220 [Kiritimatiellia bacterium]|nr:hypothetical protein [Kiritimatiellia bacterium]